MKPVTYWNRQFRDEFQHHSAQNAMISASLLDMIRHRPVMVEALQTARSVLEVGCGTGELIVSLNQTYGFDQAVGTDLSPTAIKTAKLLHAGVKFSTWDALKDPPLRADLAVCSNVLEHFADPSNVLRRIFRCAPRCLVVVPLGQQELDDYDAEGGPGHVSTFDSRSFVHFRLLDNCTFRTDGWSNATSSMQWAVLLEER